MTADTTQPTQSRPSQRDAGASALRETRSSATSIGTSSSGCHGQWYVVYSKPHREAWAEANLRRKGIDAFHPVLELPDYAAGRRRSVPLFPNYVFVKIDLAAQFYDVVWSPGVKSFVGAGDVPLSVDDGVVEFLKLNATSNGRLQARLDLKAGQEVEIVTGPFAGLIAIIQSPPDAKGRIRMLMRLLNRRAVVQMPARFVRNVWVA